MTEPQAEKQVPILAALAQATRLQILDRVAEAGPEGVAAGEIARAIRCPASTLSFHLKELTMAGTAVIRRWSFIIARGPPCRPLAIVGLAARMRNPRTRGEPPGPPRRPWRTPASSRSSGLTSALESVRQKIKSRASRRPMGSQQRLDRRRCFSNTGGSEANFPRAPKPSGAAGEDDRRRPGWFRARTVMKKTWIALPMNRLSAARSAVVGFSRTSTRPQARRTRAAAGTAAAVSRPRGSTEWQSCTGCSVRSADLRGLLTR